MKLNHDNFFSPQTRQTMATFLLGVLVATSTQALEARHTRKFRDQKMTKISVAKPKFSKEDISSRNFVLLKNAEWSACHRPAKQKIQWTRAGDSLRLFLETSKVLTQLSDMDELMEGHVGSQPWSGDYWSYAGGLLGARSFDENFRPLFDWLGRYKYVLSESAHKILQEQGQAGVPRLSPSEKYDLLVGDEEFALTASMWAQGKRYYDARGNVETWMGICHGWAPAAIMEPRPQKSLDLKSYDQKWKVHLVPSEIKGLASYSWATNPYSTLTLGERCNKKNPKRDENGRILDPACADLEPSLWHMVMVNLVGVAHQSFVMDVSYDYEVWNQPVLAYKLNYFNVVSKKVEEKLQEAMVPLSDFQNDPFKKYRSPKAETVVGVTMKVGYVVEVANNSKETDDPKDDLIQWVSYDYDLELDENGKIIGGEWYQIEHPDFIWRPAKNSRPLARDDQSLGAIKWNGADALPDLWARAAQENSPSGVMLDTISSAILRKSSRAGYR